MKMGHCDWDTSHVDWGNPINLRADKALPRKSGRSRSWAEGCRGKGEGFRIKFFIYLQFI